MAECVNLRQNMAACNCTYGGCPRRGKCCECLSYHRAAGELPACYFDKKAERTYDRSFKNYLRQK